MTTALPLRAAAARLGVREDTLRKRLQQGRHPGRKVDGSWLVDVRDHPGPFPDPSGPIRDDPGPIPEAPSHPGPFPDAPGSALAVQRATEMAEFTERLLTPWRTLTLAQAEEIGNLRAQLAAAQTPSAPPAEGQTGRSWWRRLVWG